MLSQQEPLRSQLPSWSYLLLDLVCIPNLKPFILSLFSSLYRLHFQDLMVDHLNFSFTSSLTPWTFQLILFQLVLDQFSYWPLLLLQPVRRAGKMKDSNGINHSYWQCSLYMSSSCDLTDPDSPCSCWPCISLFCLRARNTSTENDWIS